MTFKEWWKEQATLFKIRTHRLQMENLSKQLFTERLQLAFVEKYSPCYLLLAGQLSDRAQMAAIEKDPESLAWIKNPPESVQAKAVSRSPACIRHLDNPSEYVQESAVAAEPSAIRHIQHPGEKIQLEAITRDKESVLCIQEPCKAAFEAVKGDGALMERLEQRQLEQVAGNPGILAHMYTPFPSVCQEAVRHEFGDVPGIRPDKRLVEATNRYFRQMNRLSLPDMLPSTTRGIDVLMDDKRAKECSRFVKEYGSVKAIRDFQQATGIQLDPEAYLEGRRREILRQFAKNPGDGIRFENIVSEGMEQWRTAFERYNLLLKAQGKLPLEHSTESGLLKMEGGCTMKMHQGRMHDVTAVTDAMKKEGISPEAVTPKEWKSLFKGQKVSLGQGGRMFMMAKSPVGYTLKAIGMARELTRSAGMEAS